MIFRPKGTSVWKLRLPRQPNGSRPTFSTGCTVRADAIDVRQAVKGWLGERGKRYARPDVIAALIQKRLSLRTAYTAHLDGTLDALMAKVSEAANAVDLHPHVELWYAQKLRGKKGAKSAPEYRRQVLRLFPVGQPFHLTHFTRANVNARLDALTRKDGKTPLDNPTRNRYRAAVSLFAKYLVKLDLLEANFVRDIEGYGENDPRLVYYERRDAQRLIAGLPQPFAGIAAFACGFCAEWAAIATLTVADLEFTKGRERAYVRGTKTPARLRWVPLVEENRWVLPYLKAAVAGKLPHALIFPGISETRALRAQQKAARALTITAEREAQDGQHTLHDWRHTHTVQLLRDGYKEAIAAAHLGDQDVDMVRRVYGRFLPNESDYRKVGGDRVGDSTSRKTSHGRR